MPEVITLKERVGAILDRAATGGPTALRIAAASAGLPNVSALLERDDPSTPEELRRGETAYVRALAYLNIRVRSDRSGGWSASPVEAFRQSPQAMALFEEFCRREWVAARDLMTTPGHEAEIAAIRAQPLYLSGEYVAGSIQRPYVDDRRLSMTQLTPAIPFSAIVPMSTPSTGPDFRARYLVDPAAGDIRMLRVAEAAELPEASLREGQRAIRLYKFGRKLRASYETLRRTPLDQFAIYIRKLALQTEVDRVAAAIDVAINGDGNAGTAATVYNLTTLDPSTTAGNPTSLAWIRLRMKFKNPYALTVAIARELEMAKLVSLNVGTANLLVGSVNVPAPLRTDFTPINQALADGVRYGVTDDVAANYWLTMDARMALEHVYEVGSEIQEADRFISNQTEIMTFSVTEAMRVFEPGTVRMVNLNA